MAYNRCYYFQAMRTVRLFISEMGITGDKARKLFMHIWLLDDEYAVDLAKKLHDYTMNNSKPDFQDSSVMALWFRKAMAIIKRV